MHTKLNEKFHEEKEKSPRRMSGLNLTLTKSSACVFDQRSHAAGDRDEQQTPRELQNTL